MTKIFSTDVKVIMVEDEPFIRATLRQMLIRISVRNIYEAGNVDAGFSETIRVRPNIVLCDIHLSGESGLTYLQKVRASIIPDFKKLPVVMLTGDSSEVSVIEARKNNVSGYLLKPVSPVMLCRSMERALGIRFQMRT